MIPVYMERHGKRWTPSRERRYWRQSSEAKADGCPYIVIRSRGRYAKVCCDWVTAPPFTRAGPRPSDLFAIMVADHMPSCWPEVRIRCLGSYTVLERVPIAKAVSVAEDISAMAALAMRQSCLVLLAGENRL